MVNEEIGDGGEQVVACVAAVYTMLAVVVRQHHEWLVCLHKCLGVFH